MKACMYLRKSRADHESPNMSDEQVLRRHKQILMAYAKKHDIDIVDIKEEVVSGESLSRRPKMLEVLEEVEQNLYDAVLVIDLDRLGRGSKIDQGIIENTFMESETLIITPDKVYDLSDESDQDYVDFSGLFARKELKMITKRMHRGRMKTLEEGNYISPYAPLGYDILDKTLIINNSESEVVKLIFDLYTKEGYGDSIIADHLSQSGIKNKNGNTNWDRTTIRKIIQNPVYIGKITWNKRKYKYKDDGKRTSKLLDKDKWKIFEGKHEAIIETKIFELAQILSKERAPNHLLKEHTLRNPLAHILKCEKCGYTMTLRTSKDRQDMIRCYKNCGTKSSYIYLVEKKVIELLLDMFDQLQFEYKNKPISVTAPKMLSNAIKSNEKELNKLREQKNKLHDLLEQGVYDSDTFLDRVNIITRGISELEAAKIDIETKLNHIDQYRENMEQVMPRIQEIRKLIEDAYWGFNAQDKNTFLREFVSHIDYSKEKTASKEDFKLEISLNL